MILHHHYLKRIWVFAGSENASQEVVVYLLVIDGK